MFGSGLALRRIARTAEGWSAVCEEQQHDAAHLVLAAGVWSASLLKPFGLHLPLEAERGYHLVCRNPGIEINNSIMDVEHMCVASQMAAGVRVAGTAEFAGIQAAPDHRRAFVFKKALKGLFPRINLWIVIHSSNKEGCIFFGLYSVPSLCVNGSYPKNEFQTTKHVYSK